MGKPTQVGGGLATAAAAGGAVDHVANDGQARKSAIDTVSDTVGGGGSSATNAASTGGGEMVTGLSPELLAGIFLVAVVIIVVGTQLDSD